MMVYVEWHVGVCVVDHPSMGSSCMWVLKFLQRYVDCLIAGLGGGDLHEDGSYAFS